MPSRGSRMRDRTLLIVNYRSVALTARAIETARQFSSLPLRAVVVDNSESEEEVERLRRAPIDDLIVSPTNLGYGRGINSALSRCEGLVIISNPDVEFADGSVDRLFAAVDSSADLAGPVLFWDESLRWMLPPAEDTTIWSKASEVASNRWALAARFHERRRCARRVRYWSGLSDLEVDYVSGAVMATRVDVLRRLGGFDERFDLYFEETDLMTRLQKQGGRVRVVREARCRHIFNQSSSSPAESGRLYGVAEDLYLRKWSPSWALDAVRMFTTQPETCSALPPLETGQPIRLPGSPGDYLVEASPLRSFWSAAGCLPTEGMVYIPPEVVASYRGSQLFARVVNRRTLLPSPGLEFEISVK